MRKNTINMYHYNVKIVSLIIIFINTTCVGREINNLYQIQNILANNNIFSSSTLMNNITFEKLNPHSIVQAMSETDVFISVHGAGMTNIFFMKPGTAVIEIVPYPLCSCHNKDYFYGDGGYYHGTALALNIKHYSYCVPQIDTIWQQKPQNMDADFLKCSWKYLHAVRSVRIDGNRFLSLFKRIQREFIASGYLKITSPIINLDPHING